jgi:hypothetical protein
MYRGGQRIIPFHNAIYSMCSIKMEEPSNGLIWIDGLILLSSKEQYNPWKQRVLQCSMRDSIKEKESMLGWNIILAVQ